MLTFVLILTDRFGVEIEFNSSLDSNYKMSILRKLNGKQINNPELDSYGIDGGGRALEFRNINGESSAEIEDNIKEVLNLYVLRVMVYPAGWSSNAPGCRNHG